MSDLFARSYAVGTVTPVQIVEPFTSSQRAYVHDHTKQGGRELYIGGSDVSATNGFHVLSTTTQDFVIPPGRSLWAIATGDTITTQVLVARM